MIKSYLKAMQSLFFPKLCFSCQIKVKKGILCPNCYEQIEFLSPNSENQGIISITNYKEPITQLLHLFKYNHHDYLSKPLALMMAKHLFKLGFNFGNYDFITPVPLHPLKLKERGYNQSALLGKILANYFKIPYKNDIIYERKNKPSQTKLKKEAREKNVKKAFFVKKNLINKKIILIDDMTTTGATIKECSLALKNNGAKIVTPITLSKSCRKVS